MYWWRGVKFRLKSLAQIVDMLHFMSRVLLYSNRTSPHSRMKDDHAEMLPEAESSSLEPMLRVLVGWGLVTRWHFNVRGLVYAEEERDSFE